MAPKLAKKFIIRSLPKLLLQIHNKGTQPQVYIDAVIEKLAPMIMWR